MEKCSCYSGITPIYFNKLSTDFVMIGMEYCPNGSLNKYITNRDGDIIDENVKE